MVNKPLSQSLSSFIVDDKKVFRSVLRKTLREYPQFGEIAEAANADQMFQILEEDGFHPDIVFMDESLPGMSGFEAARRLLRAHKRTKVIIVSIYDTLEFHALAKEAGAIAYIVKKNLIEDLDDVLKPVFKERGL